MWIEQSIPCIGYVDEWILTSGQDRDRVKSVPGSVVWAGL